MTAAAQSSSPTRRRFSSADVLRMAELGILKPDEPVELLEGELIVVTLQGPLHASRIMALQELLARAYEGRAKLRVQLPLDSRADSLPEPDFAIVRGQASDYVEHHPTGADAVLVIEVAHTSQSFDRQKAVVYARMGVAEYWLVDLERARVEIRRGPTPDGLYTSTEILSGNACVQLPATTQSIAVSELLG